MQTDIFKKGFAVEACEGGSFIVHMRPDGQGRALLECPKHGFTNLGDLMAWLGLQAASVQPNGTPLPDHVVLNRQSFNAVSGKEQEQ